MENEEDCRKTSLTIDERSKAYLCVCITSRRTIIIWLNAKIYKTLTHNRTMPKTRTVRRRSGGGVPLTITKINVFGHCQMPVDRDFNARTTTPPCGAGAAQVKRIGVNRADCARTTTRRPVKTYIRARTLR